MNSKTLYGLAVTVATLTATSFLSSAQAAVLSFGNSGLRFDQDTPLNFTFISSQGAYQSSLSAEGGTAPAPTLLFREIRPSDNGETNDWFGSFGNAVTSPSGANPVPFTFRANVLYNLLLDSGANGTVSSSSPTNARFSGSDPFAPGGVTVRFDDGGAGPDGDFNDFVVRAEAIPEPLTMGGIALAGVGLLSARRLRQRKAN